MKLTLALILALALPAYAGGPVIIEEPEDLVAGDRDTRNKALPWIIGGIALIAILSSGSNGGGAVCNEVETPPQPGC